VWCVAVDMDIVGFAMALQTIAKAADVVHRDQMIGLAEHAEHGAVDRGDNVVEGARVFGVDGPFARLGRAVPDQRRSDRARRRDHERKPAGLTNSHDREPGRISLRDRLQRVYGGAERNQGVGIGDVANGVTAMDGFLVRVPEVKVWRNGNKAIARETLR
jgi:hypothetical protein